MGRKAPNPNPPEGVEKPKPPPAPPKLNEQMTALEFIDLINPEHGRTSCSDEDINNGFYTRNGETWHGRCRRCLMLEIANGRSIPEDYDQDELNG